VEQDRASVVQPHLHELAQAAAGHPRGDRGADRRDPETRTGLKVRAELDPRSYPLGVKVSDRDLTAVPLHNHTQNQACPMVAVGVWSLTHCMVSLG
jgi:hypothetical protein